MIALMFLQVAIAIVSVVRNRVERIRRNLGRVAFRFNQLRGYVLTLAGGRYNGPNCSQSWFRGLSREPSRQPLQDGSSRS